MDEINTQDPYAQGAVWQKSDGLRVRLLDVFTDKTGFTSHGENTTFVVITYPVGGPAVFEMGKFLDNFSRPDGSTPTIKLPIQRTRETEN